MQVISYTLGKDGHQFVLRTMPDIIILDLWLEDCNVGSMMLGLLERDHATRHILILICSAHIRALRDWPAPLREKGYDHLEKPFQPEELLTKLRSLLAEKERLKGSNSTMPYHLVDSASYVPPHAREPGATAFSSMDNS